MRLLTRDNVVWSVIAFHGWLNGEIRRKNPRPGDFVGASYKGTKPAKKAGESDANVYRVETVRNPDNETAAEGDAIAAPETAAAETDATAEGETSPPAPSDGPPPDDIPFDRRVGPWGS